MPTTGGVWTMSTGCANLFCTNIIYSQGSHDWLTGCGDSHVPSFPMARGQGKGWELSNEALLNLMFCSSSEKGNLTTGGEWVLFWRRNHEEHKEVENDLFLKTSFWCIFEGPLTYYLLP